MDTICIIPTPKEMDSVSALVSLISSNTRLICKNLILDQDTQFKLNSEHLELFSQFNYCIILHPSYKFNIHYFEQILSSLYSEKFDVVLGTRMLGAQELINLTYQRKLLNWLTTSYWGIFYLYKYSDIAPMIAFDISMLPQILHNTQLNQPHFLLKKIASKTRNVCEIPIQFELLAHSTLPKNWMFDSVRSSLYSTVFR